MVRATYTKSHNWIPNNTGNTTIIHDLKDDQRPHEVKIPRPKMQKKFFDRLFKDRVVADKKRMELVKKGKKDKKIQEMKEVTGHPRLLSPSQKSSKP